MRLQQDAACLVLGALLSVGAWAPATPAPLPRHRMAQHPSLYCGPYMDMGKVAESEGKGRAFWSVDAPSAWVLEDDLPGIPLYTVPVASRPADGNTVICNYVLQR